MDDWLLSIGLGHRVADFHAEGISPEQLPKLTEVDLRELGLTIGERKRFMQALAARTKSKVPAAGPAPAERRPMTVMFVDVVSSTSLAGSMDPEDLAEVYRRYRELCDAAITRFGGHIAHLAGDGILSCFCYPVAHENDPERAVRAALDIVHTIPTLITPAGAPLKVRIGIATGRVVIGSLIVRVSGAEPDEVVGSISNLAARLQNLATHDGIVIAEQTHALVQHKFVFECLGAVNLAGFDRPQLAWRVLRETPTPTRLAPMQRQAGLRGRGRELATIREQWAQVARGQGKVVVLHGQAGIGKSRLILEGLDALPAGTSTLWFAASAFDEDSSLRPFIDELRHRCAIAPGEETDLSLAKLAAHASDDPAERGRDLPILAALLGLPVDGSEFAGLTPEALRERNIVALSASILARAAGAPQCLVIEDLHWIDPTSCELLERLVHTIVEQPVLLLASTREDIANEWLGLPHVTQLRLGPLAPEDVAGIIQDIFQDALLPARLASDVAGRTDGVPLFAEAIALLLMQDKATRDWGLVTAAEVEGLIPASLDESLTARLDRAGAAKETAQVASVVGRRVDGALLAALSERTPAELAEHLTALVDLGIFERAGDDDAYSFGHGLLRDAAYSSLVRKRRQTLHLRVAEALQAVDPDIGERQPEILALHLTEGGDPQQAASHWLEAARRSLERSALTEAARILRRGLVALEKLPSDPGLQALRLRFSALLGPALIGLKGWRAAETYELYAAAVELTQHVPEDASHFPILWGWWRLAPDFEAQLERSAALRDRAMRQADPALQLEAHHCCWATQFSVGELSKCSEHAEAGLRMFEAADYSSHAWLYGNHDPKACAHGMMALTYWMQGRVCSAAEQELLSLSWAEGRGHLGARGHAIGLSALYHVLRRDRPKVLERAEQMIALATEQGLTTQAATGELLRGWVVALDEDADEGLRMLEVGLARQRNTSTDEDAPLFLCLLAEALAAAGRAEEAVQRLEHDLSTFRRIGLAAWLPEMLRVLGEAVILADPGAVDRARGHLADAAAQAHRQGARMLALRIAVSEARLQIRDGDLAEADARLRRMLAAIPEPEDGPDFQRAREASRLIAEAQLGRHEVLLAPPVLWF